MSVHTAVVGILWRVLETYDIDPRNIVPESMYRPGRFIAERSYVSTTEYNRVVSTALRVTGADDVGIRAAALMHPSHLGIFGHAWLASPSLIASFRMLQRYGRVFNTDLRVRIEEGPREIRLIYDTHGISPNADIEADAQVGGLIQFCRLQYGPTFAADSVSLRRAEPARRKDWDDHYGVRVQFGANENCAVVSTGVANELLTSSHAGLFEDHHDRLAESYADLQQSDIVGRVRVAIQQLLPTAEVTEENVASTVNANVRTLHRRLSQKGMTFRALLRDVRMKTARKYMADDRYSVTDVAFMLGYSDVSAFSRAFRVWFGKSPSEFRAADSP